MGLGLAGLLMIGCATASPPPLSLGRPYTERELGTIMQMRDDGEGLLEVARTVGGTRMEVRKAELEEKARRRGNRAPVVLFASHRASAQGVGLAVSR